MPISTLSRAHFNPNPYSVRVDAMTANAQGAAGGVSKPARLTPTAATAAALVADAAGVATGGGGGSSNVLPSVVAGSVPVGSASYTIAPGALYVSPTGSDSNSGAIGSPLATAQRAFNLVSPGGMVVFRGGVYHEGKLGAAEVYGGVGLTKANVTIQNYPGEAVWFDGTSVVTGWAADSGYWSVAKVIKFDRSPTDGFGALDGTADAWTFVNPSYPCAPWPEQVFIDGVQQTQVSSLAQLGPGKFYVAGTASGTNNFTFTSSKYYIGSNPAGKEVRIGDLATTLSLLAAGCTMRGIGFRRFCPSVAHQGVVKTNSANCTFENVIVEDSSTGGMGAIYESGITFRNVTVRNAGWLGIGTNKTDNLMFDRVRVEYCNSHRFNDAPVTGGIKCTKVQFMTLRESVVSNNYASCGFWTDMSVWNPKVITCDIQNNGKHGVLLEGGGGAVVANCLVTGNTALGIWVLDGNATRLWNNTVCDNDAEVYFQGDSRAPYTPGNYLIDPRQPFPEPHGMDGLTRDITVKNNIERHKASSGNAMMAVRDSTKVRTVASFYPVDVDNNFYNQVSAGTQGIFYWLNPPNAQWATYNTLATWRTASGQDAASTIVTGRDALNADFTVKSGETVPALAGLPADIATMVGKPTGTQSLGCWR